MRTCRNQALECLRGGALTWVLCALVLASGCATVPAPRGSAEFYLQRVQRRELALSWGPGALPAPLPARLAAHGGEAAVSSCAPVPEGWPEEAGSDEEL